MSAALVTGGAGFIGSHLVDRLLAEGVAVRVLDDFSSGREANLVRARAAEVLRGDLCDPAALSEAVRDVEVVFHQAAVPSVPRSVAEPERTHAVNATGTLALLEAARRAGVRRVVLASSSSVYGDAPELPKTETMPHRPRSPYAVQKATAEHYARLWWELHGLETVALRYFNVFGPRQDPGSAYAAVIPRFVTACLVGEAPRVFGDGEQSRDFTFVEDAVEANLLAARAPRAAGAAVNVGGGRRTTLNELLAIVRELCGADVPPIYAEPRSGDVRHSLADLARAAALLDYRPRVDVRQGLSRTIDHFRKAHEGDARP